MPLIEFQCVHKAYGSHAVVPDFSLTIPDGTFAVMLGPSGCGKSTVLRMLAGLERVGRGRILIDGREVQDVAPSSRGCAMVFQNYALYPHMTVADNIGYGMKLTGVPKARRLARIAEVAGVLGLSTLLDRYPSQLSGGQRQRVAIGRAIAREPKVLLFDEPLSNLDAQLRGEMRMELAALHKRTNATSIFVTHDQVEAMTLADVIVVMNQGRIEQVGTPAQIYNLPASIFVAKFVGTPAINMFYASVHDGVVTLNGDRGLVVGRLSSANARVVVGLRPESLRIAETGLAATVLGVERHGRELVHFLDTAHGRTVSVQPENGTNLAVGCAVRLEVDWSNAFVFDPDSGQRLEGFNPLEVAADTSRRAATEGTTA